MKQIIKSCFVILIVMLCTSCGRKSQYISSEVKPVLVLMEWDPWKEVVGSDTPSFVLYSDGRIIYKEKSDPKTKTPRKYRSIKINENKVDQFINRYLDIDRFTLLEDFYSVSDATDQITNEIIVDFGNGRYKSVSVYGKTKNVEKEDLELVSQAPAELLRVFNAISDAEFNNSQTWLPTHIEVMIWPYDRAKSKVKWPKKWPNLSSANTKKRSENSYSLFLEKALFEDFLSFYRDIKSKEAVEIDEKKWAIAFRFPFHGEELWLKP